MFVLNYSLITLGALEVYSAFILFASLYVAFIVKKIYSKMYFYNKNWGQYFL